MRLQYASDLHIEKWDRMTFAETLKPSAPVLVLLGDILPLGHSHLFSFFEWCSEHWDTVLWIPGNLEVWGSGFQNVASAIAEMKKKVSSFKNVIVFYCDSMMSEDGFIILGCSLWMRPRQDKEMMYVGRNIWAKPEPCPVERRIFLEEYVRCKDWLTIQLRDIKKPVVVLTYYAPVPWLQEEEWIQEKKMSTRLFELETLLRPPVVAWLYGHSHVPNIEYTSWNDTTGYESHILLTSNPRGYPHEMRGIYRLDAVARFDPNALLTNE